MNRPVPMETPRRRRGLCAALLACASFGMSAPLVHAQSVERPHLVRGMLGGGKLLGDPQADDFGVGFDFGLGYEYRFHRFLGAGVDYSGNLFRVRAPGVDGVGTFHAIGPSLVVHPIPSLTLGDLHVDVGPDLVVTGGRTRFGFHIGAAFDFALTDAIAVGPFIRYRHSIAPDSGQEAADPKLLTFGAELTLALGRRDPAPEPQPEPEPEPQPEPEPEPAAPSDRDSDGVVDGDDACPDQPETPNGYEDADGCPDAEPVVAPEPQPEPEPEPPVVAPEPHPAAASELNAMSCDVGQADVRATHSSELDELAQRMRDEPGLRILVVGHADPVGSTEANEDLSRRRAVHVRDELVRRGIDAHRIRIRWYGERRPVDRGADETARANNRRVQIFVDEN